jgi:hypothetical protein
MGGNRMAKEVDANENIEATNELNFVDGNNILFMEI